MERNKIREFYASEFESDRLELELFQLEGIRTKEIIERYLQEWSDGDRPTILDIGGGAGYYSFWLKEKGHNVSLVDLSPINVELVRKRSANTGVEVKAEVADATNLDLSDAQFDLVLLLGPLYHLTERTERIKAISEAKRVLKPGGILLAAVISRYASMFDGFQRDLVKDNQFFKILLDDLNTGIHLNETGNPEYFTTAYFHTSEEIISEVGESGLKFEKLIGIESFGWIVKNFKEKAKDPAYMEKLLGIIRMVESNDDLIAISQHIVAVGRKE